MKSIKILAIGLLLHVVACHDMQKENTSEAPKQKPSYLIEVDQLQAKMAKPEGVHLVEVSPPTSYAEGHIPGALSTWRPDYSDSTYLYQGMRASRLQMKALMGRLGIKASDTLIVYDEVGNTNALRVWWLLQLYGHKAVLVLNGGRPAWAAAGLALSQTVPTISPTPYSFPDPPDTTLLTLKREVIAASQDTNIVLLDTRSPIEFSGELHKKSAARPGCIPGSINLDWAYSIHYGKDFRFKPVAELRQLFEAKGITPDRKIIVYCHSGVRSSHTTFVLRELLGYPNVSNYDGSWVEWSQEEDDLNLNQ